ncbi:MAG TPA: sulfur carrier protein ThiS [Acidimicrobiales bacterium]|nr:sulfur carrier protein ThiS [Acidimicrobiales bacterium]
MEVIANGDPVRLADAATLPELFEAMGVGSKWVIVELNGEPVERSQMPSTVLHEGDRVELVRAVAGG